ncbi:creatinase, partial [mine drainage metagenome]
EVILILNGGENNLDKNFFYLVGKEGGLYEDCFIIARQDSITIFTSALEEESARKTGNKVEIFHSRDEYESLLRKALKNVNSVGLNYSSLNLELYKNLLKIIPDKEFVDVSVSISEARRIKRSDELNEIREAAKIGSEAFDPAIEHLREGMTEKEVAAHIVHEMMKCGASGPSFDT